jgi:hypothetical protein
LIYNRQKKELPFFSDDRDIYIYVNYVQTKRKKKMNRMNTYDDNNNDDEEYNQ